MDVSNGHTRNYRLLIKKLGDLSEWRHYNGDYDLSTKTILNKLTNGICLHCFCGHRVGKFEKINLQPIDRTIDENPELTKTCNEVYENQKINIENNAKNSITMNYDECSLMPMIKKDSNDYILIGKKCAKKYFDMSDTDIKKIFINKEQKEKQKEKQKTKMKNKMSQNPKILLQDYEMIDRGKYRGMSIYKVNTMIGGRYYLEFITQWKDISQQSIEAIEDLLLYSV